MTAGDAARAGELLEFLRGQFRAPVADSLGRAAGFSGATATRAVQAALPVILNAAARRGGSEAGAAELLARCRDLGHLIGTDGALNAAALADPAEVSRLEGQGRSLLGWLFGEVAAVTGRFGSAVGGSGASAGRVLALMAPLVLALLAARARADHLTPAALGTLLGETQPLLPTLLPAGLTGLTALLAAPVQVQPVPSETVAAAVPQIVKGSPPPVHPVTTSPITTTTRAASARRRGVPWWLLPLLLALGLGGCWLLQPRPATTAAGGTSSQPAGSGIAVTSPAPGADLPATPFTLSGTAPAGETLTVSQQGQSLATTTVGADGGWSADLPAPTAGEQTYTLESSGGTRSEFTLNVTGEPGGAAPASGETAEETASAEAPSEQAGEQTTRDGAGTAEGTGDAVPGETGAFAITDPAPGAQLPAGAFTLRGTGPAGQTVQIFEDSTSLGSVTIGDDGRWSQEVPSPASGAHTYRVRAEDGRELDRVAATVAVPGANARADRCQGDYTLSIASGQTVSQPFRFGGVGQGQGYRVTVRRGDRIVGSRAVPLDNTCGWSYQSRPGAGEITYEVRPLEAPAAEPLSRVTLTVTN